MSDADDAEGEAYSQPLPSTTYLGAERQRWRARRAAAPPSSSEEERSPAGGAFDLEAAGAALRIELRMD